MKFIDVHTHVQFAAFNNDREVVIKRALAQDVWLVNVGSQRDTSRDAVELANKHKEGVYAAVGLHPIHTEKSFHDESELGGGEASKSFTSRGEVFDYAYYKELAQNKKVVAIGECGLDYFKDKRQETKEKQKKAFMAQIELAHELKKPLMIHCRSAFSDLIKILNSKFHILNSKPGITHFFSGTKGEAKQLLDLGFSFTFGGVITFARDYDEVIEMLPLDRILSETDAPYVAPVPYRGRRNEPVYVIEVVKRLAEIKGLPVEKMAEQIFENAKKLFLV